MWLRLILKHGMWKFLYQKIITLPVITSSTDVSRPYIYVDFNLSFLEGRGD